MHRLFERSSDCHRLADTLHRSGQRRIRTGKLFKRKARDFGYDIVDNRFKTCSGSGNIVRNLIERKPYRQECRHFGNRIAGRFGCQCGRTADPGIHLDDGHPSVFGVDRELDVTTTRINTDFTQNRKRGVTHMLILFVGQRQCGRHGDTVSRVHTHRIEIFDRTDNDTVILFIADNLHLVLFPPKQRLFDQNLVDRTCLQPLLRQFPELVDVVRDTASAAGKCKRSANDQREAYLFGSLHRFVHIVGVFAFGQIHPDFDHRLFEDLSILPFLDRLGVCAQKLHPVQHPLFVHFHCDIQCCLPSHRRQNRIDLLFFDDLVNDIFLNRFNIRSVGKFGIGHNRGGV